MKPRIVLFITIVVLITASLLLVRYGQGYRFTFNKNNIQLSATGLIAVTSEPDGASIYIDNHLTSATNTTVNLSPGDYTIRVEKEGYLPWQKQVKVQKEVVTQADATLFPLAPKLESLTTNGIQNPTPDMSGTQLAFTVASASAGVRKNGIYVLNMNTRSLLPTKATPVQLVDDTIAPFSTATLEWSPNSQEILATLPKTKTTYRLSTNGLNTNPQDITPIVGFTKDQWTKDLQDKEKARFDSLKPALAAFIKANFSVLSWSTDDTKVLYTASQSATLPAFITPPLIGANTQAEMRDIKPGKIYIYDTKEDKNFYIKDIDPTLPAPVWLPTNRHVVYTQDHQIMVMEYDGTNKTTLYSGPFEYNFVFPWPDGTQLLILTTLNSQLGMPPNLYSINLK